MRSPYWSIVPPLFASLAVLGRWIVQGSGNVYTDFGKDFYVPDPDLGWRLTSSSSTWLGLDALAATTLTLVGIAAGAFLLLRLEKKRNAESTTLRKGLAGIGLLSLLVPLWAFASGLGPSGARDQLPGQEFVATSSAGIRGSIPNLPAGEYQVQSHKGTQITASVKAGGETFESRFAGDPQGSLRLDPTDLSQPMTAEFSVASASVDTGIELRSKHAQEELKSEDFPRITFTLEQVTSSAQASPNSVSFAAQGTLVLVGKPMQVEVLGTLSAPGEAGRKRLGISAPDALILKASFSLSLKESAIENDGTFDQDIIPIQLSLILVRAKAVAVEE